MSAMEIDKPLEEIIASRPKTGKGRGGARSGGAGGRGAGSGARNGARNGGPATGGAANNARARYAGVTPGIAPIKALQVPQAEATKVIISNLPTDVDESQVRDLMQSTVGPVKSVQLGFNRSGQSTGVATVIFKDKGHGNKAHAAYNNRMIDNKRPMKVEIVFDPAKVSLTQRVTPAPIQQAPKPARGVGGAAAGGKRGGGRAPKTTRPTPKTAEELDAEMAAYKTTA